MAQNASASTSLSATNIWNSTLNVQPTVVWNNGDVSAAYDPSANFSLSVGATEGESLTFTSSAAAAGFYNGELDFVSSDGTISETQKVLITVDVVGTDSGAPPLTVTPTLWNDTLLPGENTSKAFTVCTNSETSVSSVIFTPSAGPPGSWVVNYSALPAMEASTCRNEILTLAVPAGTTPTTYNGYVELVGQDASDAEATITLSIQVGGDPTDNTGPEVTDSYSLPTKKIGRAHV